MEHVDYLIIGGGIAGITLKHFLKNQNTVLLEAEPGSYKIGESIIPEQFRHPELQKLLPALMKCPSYSPKYGTTFIEEGSAASFPLPEGGLQGAMHITRTEMEQVMLDAWKVPVRHEKVIAIDLEQKIVRTDWNEYKVAHQIIDCSGPAMVLSSLLRQTKVLWPVFTTWGYWNVLENKPEAFHAAIKDRGWSFLRYSNTHRRVLAEEGSDWRPGRSTILTKIRDGMWTWQIPFYGEKLLSYGIVSRHERISREDYYAITSANIAPNYKLEPRPIDASSAYNRIYVRNNFARSAPVAATDDYILVSDAYCFADPVYSVGTGLAVNKAIEVATILNETGWTPEFRKSYCERYESVITRAVAGFEFWYAGKVLKEDAAASRVQNELLVGNVFQSNITYHYVHALAYADLPPHLYEADPFTVDWDDLTLASATEKVTQTLRGLLGSDTAAGWRFLKARPAAGGMLLRWAADGQPELTLLVSKAAEGEAYFRVVGPLGVRYLEEKEDASRVDVAKVGALLDELAPGITARAGDWSHLLGELRKA